MQFLQAGCPSCRQTNSQITMPTFNINAVASLWSVVMTQLNVTKDCMRTGMFIFQNVIHVIAITLLIGILIVKDYSMPFKLTAD